VTGEVKNEEEKREGGRGGRGKTKAEGEEGTAASWVVL